MKVQAIRRVFAIAAALSIRSGPAACSQALNSNPLGKAVFVQDCEIWIAAPPAPPRRISREKDCDVGSPSPALTWSRDGNHVAFLRIPDNRESNTGTIVILDMHGRAQTVTVPSSQLYPSPNPVASLEWIGNDRLALHHHVNPSMGAYYVLDREKPAKLQARYGRAFVPSPDGRHIAYFGFHPHFTDMDMKSHYLVVNDHVVYPPGYPMGGKRLPDNERHEFLSAPQWSPDSAYIAVVDRIAGREWLLVVRAAQNRFRRIALPASADIESGPHWLDSQYVSLAGDRLVYDVKRSVLRPAADEVRDARAKASETERQRREYGARHNIDTETLVWWP
jgi:hypothetical protein